MKLKKALYFIVLTAGISFLVLCLYFYAIQEVILFHPVELDENARYGYSFEFKERWFEPEEDVRIHALHAFSDSSKGLVIYLPGNAGTNRRATDLYNLFLNMGYDVLYPDYRGFGKSRGELWNEQDLVGDMDYLYREMLQEYSEDNIILVGYSMGSGVAAQIASLRDPAMLVLWAPYFSLIDMKNAQFPFLPDWLLRYPFRTDEALQVIDEPVYMFFAENDRVLPMERSIRLRQFLKSQDAYTILKGQGHDGLHLNPALREKMQHLLGS